MANSFLVPIIFIFIPMFCYGHHTTIKPKSALVEGLLKKVLNLSIASFSNLPDDARGNMMRKIENKLRKSAQSFHHTNSDKYVGLIMEGVRSLTSKNKLTINDADKFVAKTEAYKKQPTVKLDTELIKNIVKNIHSIANNALEHVKDPQERLDIMKNIKNKVIGSAIKKQAMRSKTNTVILNKELVEQTIDKMLNEKATEKNEARRMEFEFIDNINVNKDPKNAHTHGELNGKMMKVMKNDESKNDEKYQKNMDSTEKLFKESSVKINLPCHYQNNITCERVKTLGTISCDITKEIPLRSLCDNVQDCLDGTDESNCALQSLDKVQMAKQVMFDVNQVLSKQCFSSKADNLLIAKQNDLLKSVLKNQWKFIQKHATVYSRITSNARRYFDSYIEPRNLRKAVNELGTVINSLSSAIERTLCSTEDNFRRFNSDDNLHPDVEMPQTTDWTPSACNCNEELCVGNCRDECKTICLQKYSLGRWQCDAVGGKTTIPLELICDGKVDCFDEADENKCTPGKDLARFEAGSIYNVILDLISRKLRSSKFVSVEKKLATFEVSVRTLQKLSMMRKPDVLKIKIARDQCFSDLVAIYEQFRYYDASMEQLSEIFMFLLSLNEWLVNALKRTHSGNDRIIAADGCVCRESICTLTNCSKTCVRACAAEAKLTKYRCTGSEVNVTLPIEAICNGKNDCPRGDDEKDCSKDICRKHHLKLLAHNVQVQGVKSKGTNIGEAIKSWNIKVSANLKIAESDDRPSPKVLRDIVNNMLRDLLMTYAALETPRITRKVIENDVIQQFYEMSLIVINSLKSCGK